MDDLPVWVVDTNVLVSGLLSPFGPPGRIVDLLQAGGLRLAADDRIEAEYRDVLSLSPGRTVRLRTRTTSCSWKSPFIPPHAPSSPATFDTFRLVVVDP